jgi:hypothetical protein
MNGIIQRLHIWAKAIITWPFLLLTFVARLLAEGVLLLLEWKILSSWLWTGLALKDLSAIGKVNVFLEFFSSA